MAQSWVEGTRSDVLWRRLCLSDFGLESNNGPDGSSIQHAHAAYASWFMWSRSLGLDMDIMSPLREWIPRSRLSSLQLRSHSLWERLRVFFRSALPGVERSLNPPVRGEDWSLLRDSILSCVSGAESTDDDSGLPALYGLAQLRLLLAAHDGQEMVVALVRFALRMERVSTALFLFSFFLF